MKDKIDTFLDALKKELRRKNPPPPEKEIDINELSRNLDALQRRLKSRAERFIEKQEAYIKPNKPH